MKGTLVVNFCVTNVTHSTLSYNASGNVITCTGAGAAAPTQVELAAYMPLDKPSLKAYPNPFKKDFEVKIDLPKESVVGLTLYDLLGKQIETIPVSTFAAGTHILKFNGNYPESVYVIKAVINSEELQILQVRQR